MLSARKRKRKLVSRTAVSHARRREEGEQERVESWHIAGLDHFWFLLFKPVFVLWLGGGATPPNQTESRWWLVIQPCNVLRCCFHRSQRKCLIKPVVLIALKSCPSVQTAKGNLFIEDIVPIQIMRALQAEIVPRLPCQS